MIELVQTVGRIYLLFCACFVCLCVCCLLACLFVLCLFVCLFVYLFVFCVFICGKLNSLINNEVMDDCRFRRLQQIWDFISAASRHNIVITYILSNTLLL